MDIINHNGKWGRLKLDELNADTLWTNSPTCRRTSHGFGGIANKTLNSEQFISHQNCALFATVYYYEGEAPQGMETCHCNHHMQRKRRRENAPNCSPSTQLSEMSKIFELHVHAQLIIQRGRKFYVFSIFLAKRPDGDLFNRNYRQNESREGKISFNLTSRKLAKPSTNAFSFS